MELSLVASAAFPPALVCQEHHRGSKEFQTLLPLHGRKQDPSRSVSIEFNGQHFENFQQSMPLLLQKTKLVRLSQMIGKPVLVDVQGSHLDSVLLSFGIVEKCMKNEKILKLLAEGEDLAASLLSEVMTLDVLPSPHLNDKLSLHEAEMDDSWDPLHIQKQIYTPKPLLYFVGNSSDTKYYTVHPDGRLLFADSVAQMEDLLSIVTEFSLPKRTIVGIKQLLLVPYFTSSRRSHGRSQAHKLVSSSIGAPPKSPDNIKLKMLPKKKKNQKVGRDLYKRNYFHACESLLSVILDKGSSKSVLSLKKSASAISHLLTQISAGIAGTGLAVILSVLCKLAWGRSPFCFSRLFHTAFGFGLFWLSCAINGLRDTIIYISRNSIRLNLEEEETTSMVKRSMNKILFRAAILVAVALFRFA
ncbi:uncharacterized protein LOC104000520 isoform X1 [Musa acuminata AAA Group]|uniref:uncharacterized protein LOC104000520 isoform X1 n=2 Tax=Musa acuminata AAA Group TaxID=214697 RepID=UPI0031D51EA1